jgi:hypothetical protein
MIHKPTDLDTAIKLAQQAEEDALPKYAAEENDEIAQVDVNPKAGKADDKSKYGKPSDGRTSWYKKGNRKFVPNGPKFNPYFKRGYRGKYPYRRSERDYQKRFNYHKSNNYPFRYRNLNRFNNRSSSYFSFDRNQTNDDKVMNIDFENIDDNLVGSVLQFDASPQRVTTKLVQTRLENRFFHDALIDTGATTDVVNKNLVRKWNCEKKIFYYQQAKKASIVKNFVSVLGFIFLKIRVQIGNKNVEEIRSFYVLDTDQELLILGLPFLKAHANVITLTDLMDADIDSLNFRNDKQLEVRYFDYNERYINNLVKKHEYFVGHIYEVEIDPDNDPEVIC